MLTDFIFSISHFLGFHIGQIPLNLRETDPDFFISNCHKWMYTVRGSSILYVAKRNQRHIHPAITSEHYKDHSDLHDTSETFHKEFSWQGTQDFSGFLTTFAGELVRDVLAIFHVPDFLMLHDSTSFGIP
jgi:hercynylcysteine S-oxide lyase